MRTTIVPAQITTVEDRIAGNISLSQMVLLLTSLFAATFVYLLLPPHMHFAAYKLPVIILLSGSCVVLSLRIKDKVILNWLVLLVTYAMRPQYYACNKNDNFGRTIVDSALPLTQAKSTSKHMIAPKPQGALFDSVKLEQLRKSNKSVRVTLNKGGIDVALT